MKRWLYFIIGLLIFLMLMPYLIILIKFGSNGISKNPNDWGVYSTFVSGLMSPIFQVANVLALIYVTIVVNNWNKNRGDYELKYNAFKEFTSILNEYGAIILSEANYPNRSRNLEILSFKLYSLGKLNSHLFKCLSNDEKIGFIGNKLTKLSDGYKSFSNKSDKKEINEVQTNIDSFFVEYVNFLKILDKELNQK